MRKYSIYVLVDPGTGKWFYVGRTCRSLNSRLAAHMAMARTPRKLAVCDYIRSLMQKPTIVLLQEISDGDKAAVSQAEFYWIDKLIKEGHPLVNKYGDVSQLITPRYRQQKYFIA